MAILALAAMVSYGVLPSAGASAAGPATVATLPSTQAAGYLLLNNDANSVTAVYDSYTQPNVSCPDSQRLGITGQNLEIGPGLYAGQLDFSAFLLQGVGTEAFCPQFSATPIYFGYTLRVLNVASDPYGDSGPWTRIPGFAVHPGDAIAAAVLSNSGKVTFVLEDRTLGEKFVHSIRSPGYEPNGAVCLVVPLGTLPRFSDFSQRCRVTMYGTTSGIGDFSSGSTLMRWVFVSNLDGTVQAVPNHLTDDGSAFTTNWITSHPYPPSALVPRGSDLSGYALLNADHGSVTAVSDSFVQPSARCPNTEATENATGHYPDDQSASVGPGLYSGNANFTRFEMFQVGTEAVCPLLFVNPPTFFAFVLETSSSTTGAAGTHRLWVIPDFPIHPGDRLRSRVSSSAGWVTLTLVDATDHHTVTNTLHAPAFEPNGAACLLQPFLNLVNFTRFTQSCDATVHNVTRGIGEFGGGNDLLRFDVTNATGGIQARTSGLSDDGTTFSTTWITSMPLDYQ